MKKNGSKGWWKVDGHILECGAETENMPVWILNLHISGGCVSARLVSCGGCVALTVKYRRRCGSFHKEGRSSTVENEHFLQH